MVERLRILLVDDEPSIIKMVSKRLEVEGYEVCVALDGREAMKKVQTDAPHLIILDLMLPKMDGYEVCVLLKQDLRYQKIPVIMFTAKAREQDERLGLECGADAYIRKPFQAQELLDRIKALLAARPLPTGEVTP